MAGRAAADGVSSLARSYATASVNWDWRTLPSRLASLRPLTAEALSGELVQAIAATAGDESLARDRPASRGTVVGVMSHGHGTARRLVVVTREQATSGGASALGPATHRVYLGEARRLDGEWRMVAWKRAP